jgi:hypothetical protein
MKSIEQILCLIVSDARLYRKSKNIAVANQSHGLEFNFTLNQLGTAKTKI